MTETETETETEEEDEEYETEQTRSLVTTSEFFIFLIFSSCIFLMKFTKAKCV